VVKRKRGRRGAAEAYLPATASPARTAPRRLRVESDLRERLQLLLLDQKDPRLTIVSITRVEMSDDLGFARVYVRGDLAAACDRDDLLDALEGASGRLRGILGRSLGLRRAPELRFLWDEGLEAAERVEKILEEIRAESAEKDSGSGGP
jgi:ribosome-binding factor A